MVSKIFYFHPDTWGKDPIWRAYFSNGLVQPPTRHHFPYVQCLREWQQKSKSLNARRKSRVSLTGDLHLGRIEASTSRCMVYVGVSLNGGTPISHPKMIIFSRKNPWLLGKPTILGNTHVPTKIGRGSLGRKMWVNIRKPLWVCLGVVLVCQTLQKYGNFEEFPL